MNYICPQFMDTHVEFQRVRMAGISNPFIAREAPSADERLAGVRFVTPKPKGIDFQHLSNMTPGPSWATAGASREACSRAGTLRLSTLTSGNPWGGVGIQRHPASKNTLN